MPVRRIKSAFHIYIMQQGCRGLLGRTADDFRSFLRKPAHTCRWRDYVFKISMPALASSSQAFTVIASRL